MLYPPELRARSFDCSLPRKAFDRRTDLPLGEFAEAGDGTEAVEIMKTRSFRLVLSEINTPQMDGLQLLARIKEMDT